MTVTGVVLSITMNALTQLYQAQATEHQMVVESASWRRLSNDFRLDVHSATQIASSEGDRLELQTGDGAVLWTVTSGVAQRTVSAPEADGSANSTETYRLPNAAFEFEIDTAEQPGRPIVALTVARAGSSGVQPVQRRIEAVVGLSHQFEASSESIAEVSR